MQVLAAEFFIFLENSKVFSRFENPHRKMWKERVTFKGLCVLGFADDNPLDTFFQKYKSRSSVGETQIQQSWMGLHLSACKMHTPEPQWRHSLHPPTFGLVSLVFAVVLLCLCGLRASGSSL